MFTLRGDDDVTMTSLRNIHGDDMVTAAWQAQQWRQQNSNTASSSEAKTWRLQA
jgi:hypothetical protein